MSSKVIFFSNNSPKEFSTLTESFTSEVYLLFIYKTIIVLYNPFFALIMSTSSEKDISVAFEKLAITYSDLNANINISHFKPKTFEAINHLKDISQKHPDLDSTIDLITGTAACNITTKPYQTLSQT